MYHGIPHTKNRRLGFSLIQLLMTMAIIAMMLGLLLPAIQRVRAVADRAKCQHQMKQLALGLQSYHDDYGRFPPRRGNNGGIVTTNGTYVQVSPDGASIVPAKGNHNRYSTWVYLLPYIGEDTLDVSIKSVHYIRHAYLSAETPPTMQHMTVITVPNGPAPWYWAYKPWLTTVNGLMCPSDDASPVTGIKHSNYAVNVGDSMNQFDSGQATFRGAFGALNGYRMADITDGSSQTLAISERRRGGLTAERRLFNNARNFGPNGAGNAFSPNDCWTTVDRRTERYTRETVTGWTRTLDALSGTRWPDGGLAYNGFSTNIAPNGPTCTTGGENTWGIYAANSGHRGGVNAAFLDGSVRFIRDTIDTGDQSTLISPSTVRNGESPFGVWGALGTRNGGEHGRMD